MTDPVAAKPQNVILIGFMGSGKSTLGQKIAKGLHFDFVDTDELIVASAGKSIREIFADDGEDSFRIHETSILGSLAGRSGLVISTGGGIILRPENRAILKQLGFIVWLDAPEEVIADRVSRNSNRPLVQTENPRETIARLLDQRRPLYSETAHLSVDTGELDLEEAVHGIIESAKVHFSTSG